MAPTERAEGARGIDRQATDRTAAAERVPPRVVIEHLSPEVDCGRFPVKRVTGESVHVEADVYTDGHDELCVMLLHRGPVAAGAPAEAGQTAETSEGTAPPPRAEWTETPMTPTVNDRWLGDFPVTELGRYGYTIEAWVDRFATWQRDLVKRSAAGQDIQVELIVGSELLAVAAERAGGADADLLRRRAGELGDEERPTGDRERIALGDDVSVLMRRWADRSDAVRYPLELGVVVDPPRARFSTWYEMFPRSASAEPGRHGTFADVEARLDYVASLGFDVLYLPPIHPIGHSHRKAPNNRPGGGHDDVGSPWAIGSEEGGHKSIHPDLGTLDDFRRLVGAARERGIEVALDIAFQCSPDHPYVKEHPEWFRHRPDGTIRYAENPPKRYEDIYPLDFETPAWRELWHELKSVFEHWVDQGVRTFRVDNPHTKPFRFWEWCIGELKREHPDLVFLSEAFTRPRVMHQLAKVGFTQSYTYFAWRNTKWEIETYLTELSQHPSREYFRPNAWPNTPDILTEYLQHHGRPAFVTRLVLAATLAANYGIYGPAFELMEAEPREPGSEEYLDSEKYQLREWDLDRPDSIAQMVARVNGIRRQHPALQNDWSLRFHGVDNEHLVAYSKRTRDGSDLVLMVVNIDPHHTQTGWTDLDLEELGLDDRPYQVHDLLGGGRYLWQGAHNFVELNPHVLPAHVFVLRRHARTERDFDYFL